MTTKKKRGEEEGLIQQSSFTESMKINRSKLYHRHMMEGGRSWRREETIFATRINTFFLLTNATAAFTIILFLILPGLNICYFKNDQELIAAFKTLRVRTAIEMFLEREFR